MVLVMDWWPLRAQIWNYLQILFVESAEEYTGFVSVGKTEKSGYDSISYDIISATLFEDFVEDYRS